MRVRVVCVCKRCQQSARCGRREEVRHRCERRCGLVREREHRTARKRSWQATAVLARKRHTASRLALSHTCVTDSTAYYGRHVVWAHDDIRKRGERMLSPVLEYIEIPRESRDGEARHAMIGSASRRAGVRSRPPSRRRRPGRRRRTSPPRARVSRPCAVRCGAAQCGCGADAAVRCGVRPAACPSWPCAHGVQAGGCSDRTRRRPHGRAAAPQCTDRTVTAHTRHGPKHCFKHCMDLARTSLLHRRGHPSSTVICVDGLSHSSLPPPSAAPRGCTEPSAMRVSDPDSCSAR